VPTSMFCSELARACHASETLGSWQVLLHPCPLLHLALDAHPSPTQPQRSPACTTSAHFYGNGAQKFIFKLVFTFLHMPQEILIQTPRPPGFCRFKPRPVSERIFSVQWYSFINYGVKTTLLHLFAVQQAAVTKASLKENLSLPSLASLTGWLHCS
jgi:hypothetical protein